jgi:hypothetical protein
MQQTLLDLSLSLLLLEEAVATMVVGDWRPPRTCAAVSLEEVVVVSSRSTGSSGRVLKPPAAVGVGGGRRAMVLEEVMVEPSSSLSRPDPLHHRATTAPRAATAC